MNIQAFSKKGIEDRRLKQAIVWSRPLDWPELPILEENEQRFVGLHAVFEDSNFVALSAAGDYNVDWGDGVVENFVSGTTAYHMYDFNNSNLSALTAEGYKCAILSLTPQPGQNLTDLNLHKKHNQLELQTYTSGFLDISISASKIYYGLKTETPKDFKIYGSNDGIDWDILFEKYDQDLVEDNMILTKAFTAFGSYTKYKISILKGVTENGTVSLKELSLMTEDL